MINWLRARLKDFLWNLLDLEQEINPVPYIGLLVDYQIKQEIKSGRLKIEPFNESLINPASLDVTLGNVFGKVRQVQAKNDDYNSLAIDPTDKKTFSTFNFHSNEHILAPGECLIATTKEVITLPSNINCQYVGKSSLGRLFLDACSFAGLADAGFSGPLTLELVNHGEFPIKLTSGMKIGQLVFTKTLDCAVPYGDNPQSKYQNQSPGQGSK